MVRLQETNILKDLIQNLLLTLDPNLGCHQTKSPRLVVPVWKC